MSSKPEINKTNKTGKLYGLSLGPGDAGLITRKAWEVLQGEALWAYPIKKAQAESYALAIVQRAGLEVAEGAIPLIFPMTHNAEALSKAWLKAAGEVAEVLQTGRDVAFLVEGDASTYSTFNHLSRAVASILDGVEIETIAGVSSFHSAAARLGVPLTDVDETLAVIPAGYGVEMIERLLHDFDTLVLMKVKPVLADVIALLEHLGIERSAYFIEKAGSPEERIIRDITSLKGEKVNYLSLMLIKNPNRIKGELARGCKPKQKD